MPPEVAGGRPPLTVGCLAPTPQAPTRWAGVPFALAACLEAVVAAQAGPPPLAAGALAAALAAALAVEAAGRSRTGWRAADLTIEASPSEVGVRVEGRRSGYSEAARCAPADVESLGMRGALSFSLEARDARYARSRGPVTESGRDAVSVRAVVGPAAAARIRGYLPPRWAGR